MLREIKQNKRAYAVSACVLEFAAERHTYFICVCFIERFICEKKMNDTWPTTCTVYANYK